MSPLQNGEGNASNISNTNEASLEAVTSCSGIKKGSGGKQASCSPTYTVTIPPAAPVRADRKRDGRKTYWSKRSRYNRKFCPDCLRRVEVQNILEADTFASQRGMRLGVFVSVRWSHTSQGEANIHQRWKALLNALRIKAARDGIELAHVWVHENPPHVEMGFNTHALVSWPVRDRETLGQWLMQQIGATSATAVDVRPRTEQGWIGSDRVKYLVKGTDYATAMKYRLITENGWDGDQGIIPFQRCGTSRNIGRKARQRHLDNYRSAA